MKNIFVGNIDFDTSEENLRKLFTAYGRVERVSIVKDPYTGKSRGFAFVEMASMADGEQAIAELNGTEFGGRTLNVNEARPRPERARWQSGKPWAQEELVTNAEEQFIEILRQDVEQFEAAANRIEKLLPQLRRELQEQWIFTAKARRSLIEELRVLLRRAEKAA
jgi:cold-inducible RNA-binding protein